MNGRDISITLLFALVTFAQPSYAYLDPSTGSMILSAILGIFATIGLAVKTYWYRLKGFFRGDKTAAPESKVTDSVDEKNSGGDS